VNTGVHHLRCGGVFRRGSFTPFSYPSSFKGKLRQTMGVVALSNPKFVTPANRFGLYLAFFHGAERVHLI